MIKERKKYALDCSLWTTFMNFDDMYSHIEKAMVEDSHIATKLPQPVWMNG